MVWLVCGRLAWASPARAASLARAPLRCAKGALVSSCAGLPSPSRTKGEGKLVADGGDFEGLEGWVLVVWCGVRPSGPGIPRSVVGPLGFAGSRPLALREGALVSSCLGLLLPWPPPALALLLPWPPPALASCCPGLLLKWGMRGF